MSRGMRAAATAALMAETRGLSGEFDRLSLAVAERLSLSHTDLLAMDLISGDGRVTAGQLAAHLHFTSGAITGLIDRLERAGFARRQADVKDRRRVVVAPTAKGQRVSELFAPLASALRRATDDYSEADLATLVEFLRTLRAAVAATVESIRQSK